MTDWEDRSATSRAGYGRPARVEHCFGGMPAVEISLFFGVALVALCLGPRARAGSRSQRRFEYQGRGRRSSARRRGFHAARRRRGRRPLAMTFGRGGQGQGAEAGRESDSGRRGPRSRTGGSQHAARVVARVLARFSWEPTVRQVQRQALSRAGLLGRGITPGRIRGAAVLPELRVGVELGRVQTRMSRRQAGTPIRVTENLDSDRAWTAQARWRLDRLIFDPNELKLQTQQYRRQQLREEILAQVTRLYFLRRRLQALQVLRPARSLGGALARRLAIERLTGQLDAMTGGWFSAKLRRGRSVR